MESDDDQCSSRVDLTEEDLECIRSLGYLIYFDIMMQNTSIVKMADQVEKLAATYDRTISRFNTADSLQYFYFHFAHNFGDFMIQNIEEGVCTDKVFDLNDMEDENFTFENCHVGLRVTNTFNSNDSKVFYQVLFNFPSSPAVFISVHYEPEDIYDFINQKSAGIRVYKDPLKINQNKRIAFLKELFSQFYRAFYKNLFYRVLVGLPFLSS